MKCAHGITATSTHTHTLCSLLLVHVAVQGLVAVPLLSRVVTAFGFVHWQCECARVGVFVDSGDGGYHIS